MEPTEESINQTTEQMFNEAAQVAPQEPSSPAPTDYYQAQRNAALAASQRPKVYGSPAQLNTVVEQMIDDFKQTDYNVNKNQYEHLMDVGTTDQAEYLRQGYMMSEALPMLESLVEIYGVDALLNNRQALEKIDEVMITGNGSGKGFAESYLKQMHKDQMNTTKSSSDAEITSGLRRVRRLADSDDIRGSVSEAKRLKEKVDNGELSASEEDYKMLVQVSSYGG